MTAHRCTNCAVLRERVRELEIELGKRMKQDSVMTLMKELGLRPQAARAVMILFQAKGEFIPAWELYDMVGWASINSMKTGMWYARHALGLGKHSIEGAHGQGYRLSEAAMKKVAEALK